MPMGELVRRLRTRDSGRKGGEHGHELKIRRPGGHVRLRQARRRATRLPCGTARARRMGGASAPGARRRNRRSRCLFAEGHQPKEGGIVPRIWLEENKTFAWSRSMSETMLSCSAFSSTRSSPPTRSRACTSFLQTVSTPDEGTERSWVHLIVHSGEGFRGGETSRVLVPHEARAKRARRG